MKILFEEKEIQERLKIVGSEISEHYEGQAVTCVVVLKGAFMAASELAKNLKGDIQFEFTRVSSYEGTESTGNLNIVFDVKNVKDKNIILIEDIIDSGCTLKYLKDDYLKRGAKSVKVFALLDKKERRKFDIEADYVGFEIPNYFVVGFGLDDEGRLRELPYIGVKE